METGNQGMEFLLRRLIQELSLLTQSQAILSQSLESLAQSNLKLAESCSMFILSGDVQDEEGENDYPAYMDGSPRQ